MPNRTAASDPANMAPAHRCLPCLQSGDPDRRACALRHMMAAGLEPMPDAAPANRPQ